jgi:hypothetical protein
MKTYSIFGAGASGLYTAWRLLSGESTENESRLLLEGDILELYDWGNYNFSEAKPGTRAPGARVCTWHYQEEDENSYLELGGMRYSHWDGSPKGAGHRLVTKTISGLDLDRYSVPFNESSDPLMSLRGRNMYTSDVNSNNPAPYNVNNYGADSPPDDEFTTIQAVAITEDSGPQTRREWCDFYNNGTIDIVTPDTSIYQQGELLKNIGYWNLGYDRLGQEGYSYLSDGNGYSSNVVNVNSAQSFSVNDEFTPGTLYKTLTKGFSELFDALFLAVVRLAEEKGVTFDYYPDTRLRSIVYRDGEAHFTTATRAAPSKIADTKCSTAAFLAMPRGAIEKVADASLYGEQEGTDVLNDYQVRLLLESVLMEPSYKIGMFFDEEWWRDTPSGGPQYPAKLTSYFLTAERIAKLKKDGFPVVYLDKIATADPSVLGVTYPDKATFISAMEQLLEERLTILQENQLSAVAELDTIGPSITDMPIRQVVYFGNNAMDTKAKPVYGILASYDDIYYTTFWKSLELTTDQTCEVPDSQNTQPLQGPAIATPAMIKMLRTQLASLHFGPQAEYTAVPMPLETRYMDWSLPPFNAGYHAYKAHYNMGEVQQMVRKPSQLIDGTDAPIYIVGETYSNDQAWVEGAFCTAESVLNDFFGLEPYIDEEHYPFICPMD